jgi:AraC-like DNA-binding protein
MVDARQPHLSTGAATLGAGRTGVRPAATPAVNRRELPPEPVGRAGSSPPTGPPGPVDQLGPPSLVEHLGPPSLVSQLSPPSLVEQLGPPSLIDQLSPPGQPEPIGPAAASLDAILSTDGAGLDVLRLTDLRRRFPSATFGRPLRAPCHVLMLFSAGRGRHRIDFVDHDCRPSTLLWARPGQVHQFSAQPALDATVLLFTPDLLPPGTEVLARFLDDPFAPASWLPTGEDEEAIITEITQLATDRDRYAAGDVVPAQLLRHELAVLLIRVAALTYDQQPASDLLARFHRELTRIQPMSRRVEDYAGALGVSVRTLTRACLAASGHSAKQVVDARVTLAAKRQLACSDASVATIGRDLGFAEPTNFGRFFARETGVTPGEFRAALSS